jgi:hypothetical protein
MEVITKEKIMKFQKTLEESVRKELVDKSVIYLYDAFLYHIKTFNMMHKFILKILVKSQFEHVHRMYIFDRNVIMVDVQKNLEQLFPDCHIRYQLNENDGAEITMSWD